MAAYKGAGVTPVGPGIDEPLATIRNGAVYYYHADERGSIKAITDGSGVVVAAIQYTAFGRPVKIGSYPGDGTWASGYAYTGREWDNETGLYYYRARYYDANDGRFLSKDPIGFAGGMNLYAYVAGNPVNYTDPWGLVETLVKDQYEMSVAQYDIGEYIIGKKIEGTASWSYNCLAWSLCIIDTPLGIGSDDPNSIIMKKKECKKVACTESCSSSTPKNPLHKVIVYEDSARKGNWHVVKLELDGTASAKTGSAELHIEIHFPDLHYRSLYSPKGDVKETCWCCSCSAK